MWMSRQKNNAHSILSAKDHDHRRLRRLISHAFSEKALREQEPILQDYTGRLIKRLHDQVQAGWGCGVVNLVDWYSWTTFDLVGELGFGETFGCLSTSTHHDWSSMVFSHFKAASLLTSVKFYPFLEKILRLCLPKVVTKRQGHFQMSKDKIHRRLRNAGTSGNDFISYVLDPKLEERVSLQEIETTFNILIIAGSETTASALAGTTGYLLRNPACLATLAKEIRGTFKEESEITLAAIAKLPYLNAVIEEGLRMAPPVPSGLPRIVPPSGATVCGEWMPGGVRITPPHSAILITNINTQTNISLNQYTAYRCPLNFHRPNEFLPERWLPSLKSCSQFSHDRKDVLQPFSFGTRNCIGKSLAYAELRLILARMIWNFDLGWNLKGGRGKEYLWEKQKTFVLVEKVPLEVRLTVVQR